MMNNMLERLNQIDWKSMGAEIVPEVLMSYVQGHKVDYHISQSYEKLFFLKSAGEPMIHVQEFCASFPDQKVIAVLVPFFIEILKLPDAHSKVTILWDLSFITSYYDDYLEGRQLPRHHEYASKLRKMVWEAHDTYLTFLDDEDDSKKTAVIDLLCRFHEYADIVLPHLHQRLQVETDEWKVDIMRNIHEHKLLRDQSAKIEAQRIIQKTMMTFLDEDQQHLVRVATFQLLIEMLESETPSHVIDMLLDYYVNKVNILSSLPTYFFYQVYLGRLLLQLGVEKGVSVAFKIMEQASDMKMKFNAVYAILLLAFDPNFPPSEFGIYYPWSSSKLPCYTFIARLHPSYSLPIEQTNLTTLQKRVLEVLIAHDWIWDYVTNFKELGLPDQREDLRQFINR